MDIKRRLGQAYGVGTRDEPKDDTKPGASGASQRQPPESRAAPQTAPRTQAPSTGRPIAPRNPESRGTAPGKAETRKAESRPAALKPRNLDAKAVAASENYLKTGKPGIEKAAKFLLLLGRDEAANVIRHLKPDEIEKISREIARIDRIDTVEANEILTEFGWLAKSQAASLEGGPEIAESMLAAAFGAERAREVFRKAVPEARKPFSFLNDFEARQLMVLFKDESPQMIAMILPYIDAKLASGVISELSKPTRADVIQRIARLDRSSPDVIERVESVLRDKAAKLGRVDSGERIDGAAVLAGILKHVEGGLEGSILSGIEEDDPALSQDIRERLFTADDVLRVADRDMQKGLRDLSEREIALVLKGKSQAFRDKILSNVSQGKRTMVLEEYDIMGTVRRDEADKATRSFIDFYKKRWESGNLVLEGDDDLID